MSKRKVIFSNDEIKDGVDFQKKVIEAWAEFSYKYNDEKQFEIFAIAFGMIVSNVMGSLGVKNIDPFLNDITDLIKDIHERAQQNACYMEYEKGVKVSEGRFN